MASGKGWWANRQERKSRQRAQDLLNLEAHNREVAEKERELQAANQAWETFKMEHSQVLAERKDILERMSQAEKAKEKLTQSSGICAG